jgi:hypothetical protein
MQACIEVCTECQRVCLASAQKCLQMGGRHADADHVRTLLDCAEICRTSADFMIRGSEHHGITCGACAEICRACAESCETVGGPEMEACAEVCRRCADSCQRMAATGHGH